MFLLIFKFLILYVIVLVSAWFFMPFKALYDLFYFKKTKTLTRRKKIIIALYLIAYVVLYAGLILIAQFVITRFSQDKQAWDIVAFELLQVVATAIYCKSIYQSFYPFTWMRNWNAARKTVKY